MWKITNKTEDGRKAYRKDGKDGKYARVWDISDSAMWGIYQGNSELAGGSTDTVEEAKTKAERKLNE